MKNFDLKVGYTCNNNCIHCVVNDKKSTRDRTLQEIKEAIDLARKKEIDIITLTGGEITIRRDFFDILKYIKETTNCRISLQTNGREFSDLEFAKETTKFIDFILVAVHSHNNIVHDTITTREGSWKETVDGVKNIFSLNGKVHLTSQTVISKLNVMNLHKTYHFLNDLGFKRMNITFPHPNGAAFTNANLVVPKYSEIKGELAKIFKDFGDKLFVEAIPFCYIHPYSVWRHHDEELMNKDRKTMGLDAANGNSNFFHNGIVEDYSIPISYERRKCSDCKDCIYNYKCLGVWKEYIQLYEKELDLFPIRSK